MKKRIKHRACITCIILFIIFFSAILSCASVTLDGEVTGEVTAGAALSTERAGEKEGKGAVPAGYHTLSVSITEGRSEVFRNGIKTGDTPLTVSLARGNYIFTLRREGFDDNLFFVNLDRDRAITLTHHREAPPFPQMGIFSCGSRPKQVVFSPDSSKIAITLLDGRGFQVFSTDTFGTVLAAECPGSEQKGFVEGLFVPEKSAFFVSQMTTGMIHEYEYPSFAYRRSIQAGGIWPKFMAWSAGSQIVAVSNWCSDTVSLINYRDGSQAGSLATGKAPRGIVFSGSGDYLYCASFDSGIIHKIRAEEGLEENRINVPGAAMRHLLLTPGGEKLIANDMFHGRIMVVDTSSFRITESYRVFSNPNTMDMTPDGRYLFVSSRGPNNRESYLNRSPVNGRITVIDLAEKKILFSFEGGNQPTGLDVSSDGSMLCFSNFMDNTIELYRIADFP